MNERQESGARAPEGALPSEVRRRRLDFILIAITALAVMLFALVETRLPQSQGRGLLGSDALLVAIIDINILLLVLLIFLVGRRVLKLVFERRRGILGSYLRAQVVGAFVAVALFPAVILFLLGMSFVSTSVENWFNIQVERSLQGSLEVARAYYQSRAEDALGFGREVGERLVSRGLLRRGRRRPLKSFLKQRRTEYQLDLVEVIARGRVLARSRRRGLPGHIGVSPSDPLVRRALAGQEGTEVDPVGEADMIRAAVPVIPSPATGKVAAVVVVDYFVPRSLVKRREAIDRAFGEYLRLKIQRRPIRTSYLITLGLGSLLVMLAAIWIGLQLARRITGPIQRLAEGTRAVAHGDLDHRIEGEGSDEIGTLVTSFNRMTADLKKTTSELEARRRWMETLLANIAAGVVSLDGEGRVTTVNRASEQMLGLDAARVVGQPCEEVFGAEPLGEVRDLARELLGGGPNGSTGSEALERQLTLRRDGKEMALLLSGRRIYDEAGAVAGVVLFFEDVTHLLKVQRMEAWREVAQRIAHEIKNPLTPIQLSAQRLRRRFAARLNGEENVFDECTRTIVQQVEELKQLVNEFSTFARLPAGEHRPEDLNRLVEETLVLFREAHRDIEFVFRPALSLPLIEMDRDGIKRALINLIDNALAACAAGAGGEPGRVEIATTHRPRLGLASLEVADNGCGMGPEVKARLFEPYFSTKEGGTGLGLAIVQAIIADHRAFIRVRDNHPRGTRFVIQFPVRRDVAELVGRAKQVAG